MNISIKRNEIIIIVENTFPVFPKLYIDLFRVLREYLMITKLRSIKQECLIVGDKFVKYKIYTSGRLSELDIAYIKRRSLMRYIRDFHRE